MGLFRTISLDYRRYRAEGARNWREVVFCNQGFWAICGYRIARHVLQNTHFKPLRSLIGSFFTVSRTLTEIVAGVGLSPETDIGEGLCIFHFGPTTVAGNARIGRNCNLRQGVTIGAAGRGEEAGAPVLGDRVSVGAHAIIIGKITIGDDAAIGAGAVVTKSVPPRGVVVGNPARVISYRGSFDFIAYDGMETDPDRLAGLRQTVMEDRLMEPLVK